MNENKKFTLVELVVIIISLGLICLIVIPVFIIVLKNSNQKLYDIQVKMIEKRAENWGIDNINRLSEGAIYLNLSQLLNEGYIGQTELRDPRDTSHLLNGCILIEYDKSYKKYKYNYIEKACDEVKR
ncbi:MAG: hypothetical protein ACM3O4_01030 [Ignavibacteriales bacterium]